MTARRAHIIPTRRSIEDEIERLIAMLDAFEPEPDLEPYLGWTAGEAANEEYSPEGLADLEEQHDLETNDYDGETCQWALSQDVPQSGPEWHGLPVGS